MKSVFKSSRGYTFLELMLTVSILAIGVVGIYRILLASLDYQTQLSCRMYALNLMEHETALLENQYRATGEFPQSENGKVVDVVLDRRNVSFTFTITTGFVGGINGLMPVQIVITWPDRNQIISLKREIYLANLNIKSSPNAPDNAPL
ncbi:MAG: prepilin-type N-terminal cleavage/methylation domain-containing protein [Candidatus Omnitrophica bacterium]|nr:prepilin-type N-terminal cleavage/methylation domain-containing protein [Candidatus Omnitrophota bacterium]